MSSTGRASTRCAAAAGRRFAPAVGSRRGQRRGVRAIAGKSLGFARHSAKAQNRSSYFSSQAGAMPALNSHPAAAPGMTTGDTEVNEILRILRQGTGIPAGRQLGRTRLRARHRDHRRRRTSRGEPAMRSARCCGRGCQPILWPIAEFDCADEHALYAGAAEIDWTRHRPAPATASRSDAHVSGSAITRALPPRSRSGRQWSTCCAMRPARGPTSMSKSPDVRLNLIVRKGRATLSITTSAAARCIVARLARRAGRAPLQENLAAAVLLRRLATTANSEGGDLLRSDVRQRHFADRRRADGRRRRA